VKSASGEVPFGVRKGDIRLEQRFHTACLTDAREPVNWKFNV
jgi:hypothetical protein